MSVMPIRTFGHPVLRERARPVESFDDNLRRLAEDMLETMYAAPGVGLAANQIGMAIRLIVWDDGNGPGAMANQVVSGLEGEQLDDEGCLSVPGLYYPTARAFHVRAEGLDLFGTPVAHDAEGLLARIFQHEVDHIEGKLFLSRLSRENRADALAAMRDRELGIERNGRGLRPRPSRAT